MILNHLINVLFPKVCFGCSDILSDNEHLICTSCRHNLPLTNYHINNIDTLKKVFYGRVNIENATALLLFEKKGIVQQLLHQLKYKDQETYLEIGDRNTIREFCTINTGTVEGNKKTLIGNDNWILAYVHIAHDCIVKNNIVIVNNASLAGHVEIDNYVVLGGFTAIHQFCKIGQHAITMGGTLLSQDVPPYVRAVSKGGMASPNGINSLGLRRRGFTSEAISNIKNGYKIIYMRNNSIDEAKKELAKLALSSSDVGLYLDFIEKSNRGLIRSSG